MSLSNTVVTHVKDPETFSDYRAEFKFDRLFYSSSIKLINLGIYDTGKSATTGAYYPYIIGTGQTIRNLYLMSGTTEIDRVEDVPQYLTTAALQASNQDSEDFNRDLMLSGLGLKVDRKLLSLTSQADLVPYYNIVNAAQAANNQVPIASSALNVQSGTLNLTMLFRFLQSTNVLPMIPNLRLVIEFDLDPTHYYIDPAHAGTGLPGPKPLYPSVILEEILGQNPAEAMQYTIPYQGVLTERLFVDAVATPANDLFPKTTNLRSQAFVGKMLRDLTIFNQTAEQLAAADRFLTLQTRSPAQRAERIQIAVNGSNLLPYNGIDSPALKLYYFTDTHGPLNVPAAAAMEEVRDAANYILSPATDALIGQYSVTAVKVNRLIDTLNLTVERTYGGQAWSRSAYALILYGTVLKTLEVKGNDVRVSY